MLLALLTAAALVAWLAVLLSPWQPHRTRERLEADPSADRDLSDVSVLIPARDEAAVIARTLVALRGQGDGLEVIVVDDQSSDGTAAICASVAAAADALDIRVLAGGTRPPEWAGKLWALEQGLGLVHRRYVLLLDADIELARGTVPALRGFAERRGAALVSLMAELHCGRAVEKLLTPAFVFFFKLLYPFALANDPRRRTAAAAGGCMLVRTDQLRALGGFAAIRGALIDDCALAAALKEAGAATWLGMSHSARSLRVYGLGDFWRMVSRSAYTQLRYSVIRLLVATVAMAATLLAPPVALVSALLAPGTGTWHVGAWTAALGWLAMGAAYWPLVRFYRLSTVWALALPAAGALFLAMTWDSAFTYWRGTRATWKNRSYASSP